MKAIAFFFICIVVIYGAWKFLQPPPSPPGVFLNSEPHQTFELGLPFKKNGYSLTPLASYELDGRVLAFKAYYDRFADVCPYDLGISWGEYTKDSMLENFSFRQKGRFLYFNYKQTSSFTKPDYFPIANVHLIPADEAISQFLSRLKPDDLVSLKGKLVSVSDDRGYRMVSSLNRKDTGAGACEILYVTQASFIDLQNPGQPFPNNQSPQVSYYAGNQITVQPFRYPEQIILISELEIPVDNGSVIIPAGDMIEILREEGQYTRVRYHSYNFWIPTEAISGA